jgi:hypothetical protein
MLKHLRGFPKHLTRPQKNVYEGPGRFVAKGNAPFGGYFRPKTFKLFIAPTLLDLEIF